LLSAYMPDPSFLRVAVPLQKKLPSGDLERRIAAAGIDIPPTGRLSIPYVPISDAPGEGGRWRSQLFTKTDLGEWCSELCYEEKHRLFRRNGYDERKKSLQRLDTILTNDAIRDEVKCAFMKQIDQLWEALRPSAGTYLRAVGNRVDVDHYRGEFDDRLKRDAILAKDSEFKSRFLNGFAVVPVPRFRLDAAAWDSFRKHFVAQLHYESLKQRPPGMLFRRIKSVASSARTTAFSPEKLALFLETKWNTLAKCDDANGLTVGVYIDYYHRN